MDEQYYVFWADGKRLASTNKKYVTEEEFSEFKKEFCIELIQKDITGTEHYNVIAMYK